MTFVKRVSSVLSVRQISSRSTTSHGNAIREAASEALARRLKTPLLSRPPQYVIGDRARYDYKVMILDKVGMQNLQAVLSDRSRLYTTNMIYHNGCAL